MNPSRCLLHHGQPIECTPAIGSKRFARGLDLAKIAGLQKCSKLADDVDVGQGGLDDGRLLLFVSGSHGEEDIR